VFEYISDTPIATLITDAESRRIGAMVTTARDLYRRSESFSVSRMPQTPSCDRTWRIPLSSRYNLQALVGDYGNYYCFAILTRRGRVVFSDEGRGTLSWNEPFASIVRGDAVSMDIPALIAQIKR